MSFLQNVEKELSNFAQREVKFGEAEAFVNAANKITKYAPGWGAAVSSATSVAAFIALVEKDDAGLGPIVSAQINVILNLNQAAIQEGVSALVSQGEAFLAALVKTLLAMAAKLQAEAIALA